ncbi:MAG: glycosyltransferase [archaeon]|nr:glycosyltransferase [archaeon]
MTILYLGLDTVDYGCQSRSHECYVAETFANLGHDVIFVVERMPNYSEGEKPENLTIEVLPVNEKSFTDEENDRVLKYDFDVVFASSISGLPHALYFSKMRNKKCVVQVLDVPQWRLNQNPLYPTHWRSRWVEWAKQLEEVDEIVVNVPQTTELLLELNPNLKNKNISLIFYGISCLEADKVKEQKKEDFVVWVSGIRFYKGLDIAIYAMSLLKKKIPLVVIGVGDGTEVEIKTNKGVIPIRYIDIANQTGVDVRFLGGLDDFEKFYLIKKAKLAILPDYSFSIISMFPLEAVYCGTPCIVPNIPIAKDRYEDSMIMVDNLFDTREWANRIEEVLLNIEHYTSQTFAKRNWILENRSFRSHAEGLLKIFSQINGDLK